MLRVTVEPFGKFLVYRYMKHYPLSDMNAGMTHFPQTSYQKHKLYLNTRKISPTPPTLKKKCHNTASYIW